MTNSQIQLPGETTFQTLARFCRWNSGKSLLDSGGDSGRAWQQPPVPSDVDYVSLDVGGDGDINYPIMNTARFLDSHCELATRELANGESETIQDQFERFCDWHSWLTGGDQCSWFEMGERFLESLGYTQHARDNTYNVENDLSQNYVWELWTKNENEADWINADRDDTVFVTFIHTGADIRGGYS